MTQSSAIRAEQNQKSDDIAHLINAGVRERLRIEEKLRVLEGDRRRLRLGLELGDETLIALLPLSTRLIRALYCAGIEKLRDLKGVSEDDLCRWRNFGPTSVNQLRKFLAFAGR